MYRGLTPHKITPMSGVLHAKPDLRVVLKWKIFRPDSVIAAVIGLNEFAIKVKDASSICHSHRLGMRGPQHLASDATATLEVLCGLQTWCVRCTRSSYRALPRGLSIGQGVSLQPVWRGTTPVVSLESSQWQLHLP